jgi:hypothetical protein
MKTPSTMINSKITLDQFHEAFNWKVEKAPVYNGSGDVIPGAFETVRVNPDGGRQHLGTVGRGYRVIQCADMLGAVDNLLGEGGGMPYDYQLCRSGARFNMRLLFPSYLAPANDPGDYLQLAIAIRGAHDGTSANFASVQAIRHRCDNGMLTLGRTYAFASVRHTSGADLALPALRGIMASAREDFDALGVQVNTLTRAELPNRHVLRAYALDVIGQDPAMDLDKLSSRTRNVIESIESLADHGRGNSGRTFWDAYNGVTEYIDHYAKGHAGDAAALAWSANAGGGSDIKRRALELALVYAERAI